MFMVCCTFVWGRQEGRGESFQLRRRHALALQVMADLINADCSAHSLRLSIGSACFKMNEYELNGLRKWMDLLREQLQKKSMQIDQMETYLTRCLAVEWK